MSKQKRRVESYLATARQLEQFVPGMKRFRRRKTLKPWMKSYIARYENWLRFILQELKPIPKKHEKEFKNELYKPETVVKKGKRKGSLTRHGGIRAIRLRNTGANPQFRNINKDVFSVISNNRTWLYWRLNDGTPDATKPRAIKDAGLKAFTVENIDGITGFDIERIIEMSKKAFENPQVKAVYLWAESGRVGIPMQSHKQFVRWIIQDYSTYQETDKWVKGLAILIGEVGEIISDKEYKEFGVPDAKRLKHDRQERRRYAKLRKARGG